MKRRNPIPVLPERGQALLDVIKRSGWPAIKEHTLWGYYTPDLKAALAILGLRTGGTRKDLETRLDGYFGARPNPGKAKRNPLNADRRSACMDWMAADPTYRYGVDQPTRTAVMELAGNGGVFLTGKPRGVAEYAQAIYDDFMRAKRAKRNPLNLTAARARLAAARDAYAMLQRAHGSSLVGWQEYKRAVARMSPAAIHAEAMESVKRNPSRPWFVYFRDADGNRGLYVEFASKAKAEAWVRMAVGEDGIEVERVTQAPPRDNPRKRNPSEEYWKAPPADAHPAYKGSEHMDYNWWVTHYAPESVRAELRAKERAKEDAAYALKYPPPTAAELEQMRRDEADYGRKLRAGLRREEAAWRAPAVKAPGRKRNPWISPGDFDAPKVFHPLPGFPGWESWMHPSGHAMIARRDGWTVQTAGNDRWSVTSPTGTTRTVARFATAIKAASGTKRNPTPYDVAAIKRAARAAGHPVYSVKNHARGSLRGLVSVYFDEPLPGPEAMSRASEWMRATYPDVPFSGLKPQQFCDYWLRYSAAERKAKDARPGWGVRGNPDKVARARAALAAALETPIRRPSEAGHHLTDQRARDKAVRAARAAYAVAVDGRDSVTVKRNPTRAKKHLSR